MFELNAADRGKKYVHLRKVVKSALCVQNGNSDIEHSLSFNKNLVTAERTCMEEATITGLRLAKNYCCAKHGAHNINTMNWKFLTAVTEAHKKHVQRKKIEEEKEIALRKF